MKDLVKSISHLIEEQFPSLYREEGSEMVAFVKAYYEFMETQDEYSVNMARQMFEYNDIDDTVDDFLAHFKNKYLLDLPYILATEKEFAVKHIMDLYRSKGSPRSLELLLKLIYNYESTIYYPGKDVLKPSDSKWFSPIYLELTKSSRTVDFLNKQIVGSATGATAFIEGVVTKRVNGKLTDIAYLSSLSGNFKTGELVTDDQILTNAPVVVGSLRAVNLTQGGANNAIGDIFDVVNNDGAQGKVRVTAITDSSGLVDFEIIDGGFGFTTDADTTIMVSDAIFTVNNASEDYMMLETLQQPLETVTTLSATDINGAAVGTWMNGMDSSNTVVANGVVIAISNTDANGTIITANSANSSIIFQVTSGTFANQISIDLTSAVAFANDEILEEESDITIDIDTIVSGPFTVSETVEQVVREIVGNTVTNYAYGTVTSANTTELQLSPAWGTFIVNNAVTGVTSGASANVTAASITTVGARGSVTNMSDANTVIIENIYGAFTTAKDVRGSKTRLVGTISAMSATGATDIWLEANSSANGVIDTTANSYVEGIVVGQNTTAVGVYGNTSAFMYDANAAVTIETYRSLMLSPPRDANDDIIELSSAITAIATGENADFQIGLLENTESVTINSDLISGNNVADVPYSSIALDGSNSGVGFVDSFTINDGGDGYTNTHVLTITAGGFAGGDPHLQANASITTDANGAITAVTVDIPGEGFYNAPTYVLPATAGTVANVDIVMDYGYGFPLYPQADLSNLLYDILSYENMTIGKIAQLTGINPGTNYNTDPFVRVRNSLVAGHNRRDIILSISNLTGSFQVDEQITQAIPPSSTSKGKVLSANTTTIIVERNSFNVDFQTAIEITGSITGATANVDLIISDTSSEPIGDNANVVGEVVSANGVATAVEVIDSGYGYANNQSANLVASNSVFLMTGNTSVTKQGIGEGYWTSHNSHTDYEKYIHDSSYYQEYSYDVQTAISLDKYQDILKNLLHVAGTRMYGSVHITSSANVGVVIANSSVEII